MSEFQTSRIWFMRACFVMLALTVLILHLLPLSTLPQAWALPDLLLGFAFAWSVRRPDYVPIILLAAILLLADLLLQRPPGLWAVLVLLCCENLKMRSHTLRVASFAVEWATVAVMIFGATAAYRLTMAILLIDQPSLGLQLLQTLMTVVSYPLLVFVTHALMGVRKAIPGDIETLGGHS